MREVVKALISACMIYFTAAMRGPTNGRYRMAQCMCSTHFIGVDAPQGCRGHLWASSGCADAALSLQYGRGCALLIKPLHHLPIHGIVCRLCEDSGERRGEEGSPLYNPLAFLLSHWWPSLDVHVTKEM